MKTGSTPINIIIADDQEVLRKGTYAILKDEPGINVLGYATNGSELVERVMQYRPDVVLTDIKMPMMNGIEATLKILESFPETAIVAFTMFSDDYLIMDMLNAGAMGYVLKDASTSDVVEAIQTVYKNQEYYCMEIRRKLKQLIDANIYDPSLKINKGVLSNRERQVLLHICLQRTNPEIADLMKISKKTVEVFRKKLLAKTNCKNMAGLVIYAIKLGIYEP